MCGVFLGNFRFLQGLKYFLRRAVSDLLPTANLLEFAAVGQVNLCGHYRCVLVFVIGGWAVWGSSNQALLSNEFDKPLAVWSQESHGEKSHFAVDGHIEKGSNNLWS
ncbi:hypothetical protein CUMW_084850 [Citrus unshiu]|nr:hypothetical protein CUMW_084850 [Citrus unshiu]